MQERESERQLKPRYSRDGIILSLCDRTTIAVEPWAAAGWECWCVDALHEGDTREGNIRRIGCDVRDFIPPPYVRRAFAFPPCTHLAVSGARWFAAKGLPALIRSLEVIQACVDAMSGAEAWWLENPVGRLSTCWRKPDYTFDPCDYAGYLSDPSREAYTKKTCLWTGGAFVMPPTLRIEPTLGSIMHLMPPSPDRGHLRSVTPRGWAMAVYEANKPQEPRAEAVA